MFKQLKKLFTPRTGADKDELLVNAYSTLTTVAAPSFAHRMEGRRDESDPEMRRQLDGLLHYLQSLGDGKMTSIRYHAMRHIQRTRHQFSFAVSRQHTAALTEWALQANALLLLPDGQLRDPHWKVLVSSTDGGAESEAAVPFPAEARQRKAATEATLAARGLHPAATLPPLLGVAELRLRSAAEVGSRAVALLAVALRAESLAAGKPVPVAELEQKLPGVRQALSPQETAFLQNEQPSEAELTQFSWRYESLLTLEWALGLADLPWPDGPCDAATTSRTLLERAEEAVGAKALLRPGAEILDALDLHYRLHWLVRQSRIDGQALPAGLDAGVVAERHHALNWLTRFENADWDETDTPT